MKTHFFEFALPAIAGIHDETEGGLQGGYGPQRSLGMRIGRISALALLCAMGAGTAAGQESDPVCPRGEAGDKQAAAGECLRQQETISVRRVRIRRPLIDGPIPVSVLDPCHLDGTCEYLLDAVLVSGRAQSLNDTAASVSVIGGDEIERLNALRLGDVLANVPGVFFSGLNGPRETPQIRNTLSFDNRTLFVEDGVPLQSSVFFDQSALGYSTALVSPGSCLLYTSPSPRDRG